MPYIVVMACPAGLCAHEVVPSGIPCCGMAGDRGMRYTELTGSSLQHLNLPKECKGAFRLHLCCMRFSKTQVLHNSPQRLCDNFTCVVSPWERTCHVAGACTLS
jgi:hypothetical protein